MKKIKSAKVRVQFDFDYTDYANDMIKNKIVTSIKELKNVLQENALEDTIADLTESGDFNNMAVDIQ